MLKQTLLALAALGLISASPAQAQTSPYIYTTIDDPQSQFNGPNSFNGTVVNGINDTNEVVGYNSVSSPSIPSQDGFSHQYTGTPTTADNPNFTAIKLSNTSNPITQANGVNNGGQIVGDYTQTTPQGSAYYGFSGSGSSYPPVTNNLANPSSPAFTIINGINSAGTLVGDYQDAKGVLNGIVGTSGAFTAFVDPQATTITVAAGINSAGDIVGFYQNGSGYHGFLDTPGTSSGGFTTINDPVANAVNTQAEGINDLGQIVGYYQDSATGLYHGFLDNYATGSFLSLDDPMFAPGAPLPATNPFGRQGTFIYGINNSQSIVGSYTDTMISNGSESVVSHGLFAAAPEPAQTATLGFAALGLAGLLLRARKKAAGKISGA